MVLRVMLRMDGRRGVGYPPSMILLPLILAAASPESLKGNTYTPCVVSHAKEWAIGPDEAQVIVRTAEEFCRRNLRSDMEIGTEAMRQQVRSDPSLPRWSESDLRAIMQGAEQGVTEGARTKAYAAALDARSKKTP